VRVDASLGFSVNGRVVPSRFAADDMDGAPTLFTGDCRANFAGGRGRDQTVTVTQTDPLPLTVVGIFGTLGSEA
jgi:hypothetical protein